MNCFYKIISFKILANSQAPTSQTPQPPQQTTPQRGPLTSASPPVLRHPQPLPLIGQPSPIPPHFYGKRMKTKCLIIDLIF